MAGHDKSRAYGIRIISPVDGDIVNSRDGIIAGGKLCIPVTFEYFKEDGFTTEMIAGNGQQVCHKPEGNKSGQSETERKIKVNGITVSKQELKGNYIAEVCLCPGENLLTITYEDGSLIRQMKIYWYENLVGRYRFSVDDNILLFRDITENSSTYKSAFDNPYLKVFKEAHDRYGAKVHLNVYYETDGFNLSQMTDKYKSEWRENSDWLAMTFHALRDKPDMIYKNVTYEEIKRHYEMVTEQIIRFAGEKVLSPFTTIHWGEVTREGCIALKDSGIRGLVGYFQLDAAGEPEVSYYLDKEQTTHLSGRDAWRDNETGLIFIKHDIVVNITKMDEVIPHLEKVKSNPQQSGFMELLIHEQYFHKDYFAYQPDYREKVLAAVEWAHSNGYRPAFLKDLLI